MKRKFEATIIWCEARYSKEVEIEVTEEENGVIDDLWKDSRDWEAFSASLKGYQSHDTFDRLSVYERLVDNLDGFEYSSWVVEQFINDRNSYFTLKDGAIWDQEYFTDLDVKEKCNYIGEGYLADHNLLIEHFENTVSRFECSDGYEFRIFRPVEIDAPLHHCSFNIFPTDISRLPLRFFEYGDGLMAFSTARRDSNFVLETLLQANLKCFGNYSIIGYSMYADKWDLMNVYDVYHTDLPKDRFLLVEEAEKVSSLRYEAYEKRYDDFEE